MTQEKKSEKTKSMNAIENILQTKPSISFTEDDIKKANNNFSTDGEHVYVNSDFLKKLIEEEIAPVQDNIKNTILDLREQNNKSNSNKNNSNKNN